MLTSRVKSGHLEPPSGIQKRFEQFSRHAQTEQLCLDIVLCPEILLLFSLLELVDDFIAAHETKIFSCDAFKVTAIRF